MLMVARIIVASLVTALLGVGIGFALFGQEPDVAGISFCLGCVGGVIGAVAGAGREIAAAMR